MRTLKPDSVTTLQTIAGGAVIKQGTTLFNSDSAVINSNTKEVEAFGHVHINQADSVHTYGDYLKYLGNSKTAYLKRNVKLTDQKGTLFTEDLDYNLNTGIGNYHGGGKVLDRGNVITSREGTYYSDTKDVYFRNNVKVRGPKNNIDADSLIYNMQTEVVSFTGQTHIMNKQVNVVTTQGTYDLKTNNAFFTTRTAVKDSSKRIYIANNIALDDKSGSAQLEGNAIIRDSANGVVVTGNQIFLDNTKNSFLATRKPVMIIINKGDSTFIAGDTLYSGVVSRTADSLQSLQKKDVTPVADTSISKNIPNVTDTATRFSRMIDSLVKVKRPENVLVPGDSTKVLAKADSLPGTDSLTIFNKPDSSMVADTLFKQANPADTSINLLPDSLQTKDSTIRYFLAFHNVRIFNDSLQAVCDSLFFSGRDSVFRLFYNPVVWSAANQVTGDTMFLFTKNKKAERMYVFEKGMIVNKTKEGFFNQITGKTINGYFVDGKIDYMRVKGSQAESIYFAQDEDSAYVGMNRATGDVIDMYFVKDDLNKVLFVNDVSGKMYPMRDIPKDQRFLRGFEWLDAKRPKDKYELFE